MITAVTQSVLDMNPGRFSQDVNKALGMETSRSRTEPAQAVSDRLKGIFQSSLDLEAMRHKSLLSIRQAQTLNLAGILAECKTNLFRSVFTTQDLGILGGFDNHLRTSLGLFYVIYHKLLETDLVKDINQFKQQFKTLMKNCVEISLGWTSMRIDVFKKLLFNILEADLSGHNSFHKFRNTEYFAIDGDHLRTNTSLKEKLIAAAQQDIQENAGKTLRGIDLNNKVFWRALSRDDEVRAVHPTPLSMTVDGCPAAKTIIDDTRNISGFEDLITYTHNLLCDLVETNLFPQLDRLIAADLKKLETV